jgi:hypothetical protein
MGVDGRAEGVRPQRKGDDMKALAAVALGMVLLLPQPASAVSADSFDQVQVQWTRAHVQRVFHGKGTRVVMWAGPHHRHLVKSYPADDGGAYEITYVGRLSEQPYAGRYVVQSKERTD